MSFTFTNYAAIPPQETALSDIIGKILGGYTDTTKARYLQPGLQEQLKHVQLQNQYYGPNMESQIALRGAHAGQARAHTGLLGEQIRAEQMRNQSLPQQLQAQMEAMQLKAMQNRMFNDMLRQKLDVSQQQPLQTTSQYEQGMGMAPFTLESQPEILQNIQHQLQQKTSLEPTMEDMFNRKFFGVDSYKPRLEALLKPQTERKVQLAKEDAKKISALEDQALSGYKKQETFNELNQDLGSREFEEIRKHPLLGKHELWWFEKNGTPEQQEMIGRLRTHMGNIIKDSSRDFAGQFRVGEQALLNSMKPNESDSLSTMRGKAEALTYMNQLMTKRAEFEADFMRNYNMSALQAKLAADKEIDPKAIKKKIKTILHPASNIPTPEQARAELERRRKSGGING